MRGLCLAILDEADSILLDEADVPLILSHAVDQPARRAFLWQALALARRLDAGRDFELQPLDRRATLTRDGSARLAELCTPLGGPWRSSRYRREAITTALAGLHLYRRDEHYLVRNGRIELLDEVSGRVAAGRVWSRGLHTVVEMKEGLRPSTDTETVAQITFQRFFLRYWRLAGVSGTLRDAAAELRAVYGARVVRVPLHRACCRVTLPPRRFPSHASMFDAAAAHAARLQAAGRPVLIGTDSVADSRAVSARLAAAGIEHAVLNAAQDADEAAIVAAAGGCGRVTVATRMAGRGTDIVLDSAARAAGGLHVICCQHNPSRRLDRQLAGRAARQGDPGSVENWFVVESGPAQATGPGAPDHPSDRAVSHPDGGLHSTAPETSLGTWSKGPELPWLRAHFDMWRHRRWPQWREDRRRSALRRLLLQQDIEWDQRLAFAGTP